MTAVNPLSEQGTLFLATVLIGAGIGLFFDLFRVLRRVYVHRAIIVQVQDFIFWICATGFLFFFFLDTNFGEIRPFSIMGAGCGAVLYFATLSPFIIKILEAVLKFAIRVIIGLVRIIIAPIRYIFRLITPPLLSFIKKRHKNLRTAAKYGKMHIRKTKRNWQQYLKRV